MRIDEHLRAVQSAATALCHLSVVPAYAPGWPPDLFE